MPKFVELVILYSYKMQKEIKPYPVQHKSRHTKIVVHTSKIDTKKSTIRHHTLLQ